MIINKYGRFYEKSEKSNNCENKRKKRLKKKKEEINSGKDYYTKRARCVNQISRIIGKSCFIYNCPKMINEIVNFTTKNKRL